MTTARAETKRCRRCGHVQGGHGLVHVRHGNGGGHNEPCPSTEVIAAAEEVSADQVGDQHGPERRDQLVANLVAGGVSMYRVAKVLGVSESGVRKMVDRVGQPTESKREEPK